MAEQDSIAAREARAAYMREYGRKHGAMPVKGVLISCERCGKSTEKHHHAHDWCSDCVKPAQRERRNRNRALKGAVSVGSALTCKNCSAPFVKVHKRQFHCAACMALVATDSLPAYRLRQSKYLNEWQKAKRQTDPSFAIRQRISAQIGGALRGGKAGRSWESIVGYTLQDLMRHLELQFVKGMTWENRAEWHIDHITPLKTFHFTGNDDPEVARAWALSNLRPLWSGDNIRKRDKRTHLI